MLRLSYWNVFSQHVPLIRDYDSNGPMLTKRGRIIRVLGQQHTPSKLQWIRTIAEESPNHIFLVYGSIEDLASVHWPFNAIPVWHVNKYHEYADGIKDYLSYCSENVVETPTLSIHCSSPFRCNKEVKWLLLTGNYMDSLAKMLSTNRNIPVYVEKVLGKRTIPASLSRREIPLTLVDDVSPLFQTLLSN